MFDSNQLASGTLTNTGAQTATVLLTIDSANGNTAANPIVENAGPGFKDDNANIRCVITSVAGTLPTFQPYLQHSDDSISWYRLTNPSDVNGAFTTVGTANLRVVTRKRYVRAVADTTGTSYAFGYQAGINSAMGG